MNGRTRVSERQGKKPRFEAFAFVCGLAWTRTFNLKIVAKLCASARVIFHCSSATSISSVCLTFKECMAVISSQKAMLRGVHFQPNLIGGWGMGTR